MKKIVLSAVAILAFGFANAQDSSSYGFSQGNVIVEGNIQFSSTNDKNTEVKTSELNFNPKVGYFLTDKFAVGVELEVGSDKAETAGTDTDKNSNFNAGVFGRYYFLDLGQRFKTYAEAGVGFGSTKSGLGAAEAKSTGVNFDAGLGINYFVSDSFAINFGLTDILGYSSSKAEDSEAVSTFTGNFNVFKNFFDTPTFGLTYKF